MNTVLLLAARFDGSPVVALDEIAEEFFRISPREANELAAREALPVPTFRLRQSQRAPRMVHIEDLAKYVDQQRAKAAREWERAQV